MRISAFLFCSALLAAGTGTGFASRENSNTGSRAGAAEGKTELEKEKKTPEELKKQAEEAEKNRFKTPAAEGAVTAGRDYLNRLFQEKEEKKQADLLSFSGVSTYMGAARKSQLEAYYGQMRNWLSSRERDESGNLRLEVISSAMEGNLAAVVFTLFDKEQPLDVGILPVLIYKDAGNWAVAPFLSDFSNTKLPLDHDVSLQQKALSQWADSKGKDLVVNASRIAEDRIKERMAQVRSLLKVNEANNGQLIRMWERAMRAGDSLTIAALGEIGESSHSSAAVRLKQSQGYVTLEEKKLWQLRLTGLIVQDSTWVVPLEGADKKEGKVTIGVIPFKADGGSDSSTEAYSFEFSIGKRPDGDLALGYPKEFYPKPQVEFWDNGLDETAVRELKKKILEIYLKTRSRLQFDSPVDFAQEYIKRAGDAGSTVADYMDLHDDSFFAGAEDLKQLGKGWFEKTEGEWKRVRNLIAREKEGTARPFIVKKSTELVTVDPDHTLLLVSWYKEGTVPRLFDIQAVWMVKKEGKWLWLQEAGQIKDLTAKLDLQQAMKNLQGKIILEKLKETKIETLPVVPEWNQKMVKEPDKSLKHFLSSEFSKQNSLYDFINQPYGLVLEGDKNVRDRYFHDKMQYFNGIGQDDWFSFVFDGHQKPDGGMIVLKALQYGDWGILGVAFRKKDKSFLLGYPMVKVQGDWKFLWTGTFQYGAGKEELPLREEGAAPQWQKMDSLMSSLFKELKDKQLVPLSVEKKEVDGEVKKEEVPEGK